MNSTGWVCASSHSWEVSWPSMVGEMVVLGQLISVGSADAGGVRVSSSVRRMRGWRVFILVSGVWLLDDKICSFFWYASVVRVFIVFLGGVWSCCWCGGSAYELWKTLKNTMKK